MSRRGSGSHGRRARREEEAEHENHERWAVSYADMMTVLVGLFIVLYAISTVDQVKYEQLRQSLAIGFGNQAPSQMPGSDGVMDGVESFTITPDLRAATGVAKDPLLDPPTPGQDVADVDAETLRVATAEYERLTDVAQRISDALSEQGLAEQVRFRMTARGLVIGLVADDVFFAPDTATLTDTADRVVGAAGSVLAGVPDQISVEGHANVLPTARYPTNWELSSDRATQVLRRMLTTGVAADRIAAVGFGDARPLAEGDATEALDTNRRVDIVVLSSISEEARALLPKLAAAQE